MARYREKDETDLQWNKIRRRATREVDTQIADIREEILNKVLSDLWGKFVRSLESGATPELEGHYQDFVGQIMRDAGVNIDIVEVG